MMDPRIELSVSDDVARITICRVEKLNALDHEMVQALIDVCLQIERSGARVAILTGEGKAFSAGGDIDAWSSLSAVDFGRHWVREGHTAFDALTRLAIPLIAVLNGHCLGGGLELATCADFRIAEDHIKLGLPETGLGIIPGWSGTQRAARRYGAQVVRRMSLMGEVFTAHEAQRLGVVDHVVAKGEGLALAMSFAEKVLKRGPQATELSKMLINASDGEDVPRTLEAIAGLVAAGSDDLKEGLAAFKAKREPKFRKL